MKSSPLDRTPLCRLAKVLISLILVLIIIVTFNSISYASAILPTDIGTTNNVNVTSPPKMGELRIIVIPVDFEDASGFHSREQIVSLFKQVSYYYYEASYGQVQLTFDVAEWYRLPKTIASYRLAKLIGGRYPVNHYEQLAIDVIHHVDKDIDFSQYDFFLIFAAGDFPTQICGGLPLGTPWIGDFSVFTDDGVEFKYGNICREDAPPGHYIHELGHILGHVPPLYDAPLIHKLIDIGAIDRVSEAFSWLGFWDPMAANAVRGLPEWCIPDFCAWSKIKLGWIPEERVKTIQIGQAEIVTIDPLEIQSNAIQVLKIPVAHDKYYLVEVRHRIGCDDMPPDFRSSGVLVTYIDEINRFDEGIVRAQDSTPDTDSVDDGAFDLGPNNNPVFIDETRNVAVAILEEVGFSYKVIVCPASERSIPFDSEVLSPKEYVLRIKETTKDLQQVEALTALQDADKAIDLAWDEGRREQLGEALSLREEAIAAYETANYQQTIALANEAIVAAEKATYIQIYYDAQSFINKAGEEIEQAQLIELHSQDARLLLEQAIDKREEACTAFSQNDFASAKWHAERALSLVSEALDVEESYLAIEEARRQQRQLFKIGTVAGALILIGALLWYFWRRRKTAT